VYGAATRLDEMANDVKAQLHASCRHVHLRLSPLHRFENTVELGKRDRFADVVNSEEHVAFLPYTIPPGRFLGDVMNNLGGGVGQGSDLVLYNAFDWEHLRKRFIALPGGPRTARLASGPRELTAALNAVYATEPEFNVERPADSLPSRPGHAWQWTSTGLMPARAARSSKSKASISGGAEELRAWLAALGVKKAHSPVGDRPLSLIVNPNAAVTVHNEAFDASLNWLEKPPRAKERAE
jgi:hypothetical protein